MSSRLAAFDAAFQNVPDKPILISQAGHGTDGTVYICLPLEAIRPPNSPLDYHGLTKQLVAVKILTRSNAFSSAQSEVAAQLQISAHPSYATVEKNFRRVLDWDKQPATPSELSWFSMQAVYPGISIFDTKATLNKSRMKLPVEIIAHMFLQIGGVLRFLHNDMKMVHDDLHTANVLIDVDSTGECGLPNFVLIDFGKARISAGATMNPAWTTRDTRGFCDLFYDMQHETDTTSLSIEQTVIWEQFKDVAAAMISTYLGPPRDLVGLEQIWATYKGVMGAIRDNISSEGVAKANEILRMVLHSAAVLISEEDLEAAIESARFSRNSG